MYEELIKSLRICGDWTGQVRLVGRDCCDGCKYQKDGVCESFKGNKELLLIEAADAIETLSKDLVCKIVEHDGVTELSVAPRWIPVTERLPLLNTPVLATDGIEVDISWMYGVPPRWITSYTAIDEDKLTHWMPLPKTPQTIIPAEEGEG